MVKALATPKPPRPNKVSSLTVSAPGLIGVTTLLSPPIGELLLGRPFMSFLFR